MRRWVFVPAALLLMAAETGCSHSPTFFSAAWPTEGPYSCVLADAVSPAVPDPAAPSRLRYRSVRLRRAGDQILLKIGAGNTQRLDPVIGSRGQLFANTDYGWRIANTSSVLTDAQNIRTYNCEPATQQAQRW
jgi:hypothetical protein